MISLTDKIFSYSAVALTLAGLGPTGRKETTLCCCCLCLPTIHSLVACLFGSSHSLVPSSILIGLSNALLVGAFNPVPRPAPPHPTDSNKLLFLSLQLGLFCCFTLIFSYRRHRCDRSFVQDFCQKLPFLLTYANRRV